MKKLLWAIVMATLLFPIQGFAENIVTASPERASLFRKSNEESCQSHLRRLHVDKVSPAPVLSEEFSAYLPLVEKALSFRATTIQAAERLNQRMGEGKPLSGDDLDLLGRGAVIHADLRNELFAVAEAHECWLDIDPEKSGISSEDRLKGVMLSLSAALVLYDNYLLAVSFFEENEKLRRILNEKDAGYGIDGAELSAVAMQYNSAYNRQRVRSAIKFYEKGIGKMPKAFLDDPEAAYMNEIIRQSPSYNMTKRFSPLYVAGRKLKFLGAVTSDTLKGLNRDGVNLFSMLFGNTVGLVETRKGKLYNREDVIKNLGNSLQAGDILLEKTPFRLTDRFIPGHWGHVATWIGNEEELKALGIWNDPVVAKRQKEIREGRIIVEALRSGVEMNAASRFINVDDLLVLRAKDMKKEDRAEIVIRTLRQVGKDYDFNFDVETSDRIVCSELVYTAFKGIEWPTSKTLGRSTISPDNVASKALEGGPLDIVLLYHDGQIVDKDPVTELTRLMKINQTSAKR